MCGSGECSGGCVVVGVYWWVCSGTCVVLVPTSFCTFERVLSWRRNFVDHHDLQFASWARRRHLTITANTFVSTRLKLLLNLRLLMAQLTFLECRRVHHLEDTFPHLVVKLLFLFLYGQLPSIEDTQILFAPPSHFYGGNHENDSKEDPVCGIGVN